MDVGHVAYALLAASIADAYPHKRRMRLKLRGQPPFTTTAAS